MFPNLSEISRKFKQRPCVKSGIVWGILEHFDYRFGRRMACSHRHGRNRSIQNVRAGFRPLQESRNRKTGGRMRMDFHRKINLFFDCLYKLIGYIRFQKTRHIFYADRIRPEIGICLCKFRIFFYGMKWSYRIGNCHLHVFSCFFRSFCGAFHVPRVVTGIKNTENIDSVLGCSGDKFFNHIIRIMTVAQKILRSKKHHYL